VSGGGTNCTALIPDDNSAVPGVLTSTITVPAVCSALTPLTDVDVSVNLIHDWVGDLRLRVLAPDGTAATLVDRPVTAGDCASDDINTTFSDGGAAFPCSVTIPASGTAPLNPVTPLSAFNAVPTTAGAWTLEITDFANSGIGALNDWSLVLTCGAPATVTIAAIDAFSNEAGDTLTFRVTRSVVSGSALAVNLAYSGTASSADYLPAPPSVLIPGGAAFVDVTITPVADATAEGTETVIVTVSASGSYTVGAPGSASGLIADGAGAANIPLASPLTLALMVAMLALLGLFALRPSA
jgi:subtilisin-like proprotein convertase family protein